MSAVLSTTTAAALFNFRNFSKGFCHVMKITTAKSDPKMGLLTKQPFCFSENILAGDSKMAITTTSVASDQSQLDQF